MIKRPLEPGIKKIFRIFLVVQLVLIYGNVHVHGIRGSLRGCPWCAVAFASVCILLLLVYLSIPWLEKKLGRFYFPIALIFTATFSLVAQDYFLYYISPAHTGSSEETAWQLFLFLFIPLVLTGWQYDFKAVVLYCLFTGILDTLLMFCGREDFPLFEATYHRLIFIRTFSFLIVGWVVARIVGQMRTQRAELQEANRKLVLYANTLEQLTESRERNRIARELHDTLAHTLSSVAVQLEGIRSLWESDPDKSRSMLEQSLEVTRSGLTETRKAIQALRASPLDDLGIQLALRELAQTAAERAGFDVNMNISEGVGEISKQQEGCIYRVAQEALENIVRHSQAKQVSITFRSEEDQLVLTIQDNGVGFEPGAVDMQGCYGLQGLRERAEMAEGRLSIESKPGEGTHLRLEFKRHD